MPPENLTDRQTAHRPGEAPNRYAALKAEVAELRAAVDWLKKRYETDDRFAITRAKIVRWMKSAGVE